MEQTEITLDPVLMNVTNRVSAGRSKSIGMIESNGGLLLQGEHHGKLTVKNGPLVIFDGAHVTGEILVDGDVYVFGKVGGEYAAQSLTNVNHPMAKSQGLVKQQSQTSPVDQTKKEKSKEINYYVAHR